jgi:hypothetical protein
VSQEAVVSPVDAREVRPRIRTFAIGVAVVTYRSDDGVSHGATVNSFTAVSLDPPLPQTTDPDLTGPATLKVPPFAINVLSIQQRNGAVPFAEVSWARSQHGPLTATFRCRLAAQPPWHAVPGASMTAGTTSLWSAK